MRDIYIYIYVYVCIYVYAVKSTHVNHCIDTYVLCACVYIYISLSLYVCSCRYENRHPRRRPGRKPEELGLRDLGDRKLELGLVMVMVIDLRR